jgi:nickel transport protein
MKRRIPFFTGAILLLFLFVPTLSTAHRVNVFAWMEGDTVYTESFFSDGTKSVDSRIDVFDPKGKLLLTGNTDEEGRFSFKIPDKTDLKIVLNASMGHRAEYVLSASEMTGMADSGYERGGEQPAEMKEQRGAVSISKEEIRSLMEEVLDEKLRPIIRRLAEIENRGPTISEVVAGIGYIFGLMGVALYFRRRKKTK